uniref:Uncharacterized protein n=1 Tax=Oreochromis niloticus TaxID=8128 RepID=A0A669CB72_ORENI
MTGWGRAHLFISFLMHPPTTIPVSFGNLGKLIAHPCLQCCLCCMSCYNETLLCKGIDPELYELTISKLEINTNSSHPEDTLNRLMSSAEKTSISVRKFLPSEELSEELRSEEASRVIAVLPNLSFMKAKVLMFPSILLPKARCSPK